MTTRSTAGRSALLIIDMINTFAFDGGTALARHAAQAMPHISALRARCRVLKIPAIYCNDNFGRWRSDFRKVYEHCARPGSRGAAIAAELHPSPSDYFILKPKHSAFFSTPLELLLRSMKIHRLILTGISGDGCVLCTATDAHIRDYRVTVASDATASQRPASNRRALAHLREAVEDVEVIRTAALVKALRH
jgi:nicotinamidase-related amidase